MAKTLVVGGAGYVGSHVAKALSKAGHEVIIYDNLSTGFESLALYGRLVRGDILDRTTLQHTIDSFQPDAVLHFAAKALVGESVSDPGSYFETNVRGTLELLHAIRRLPRLPVFIFSSTCSVYGAVDSPISELDPIQPMNPYAVTKRMAEEILKEFDRAYGLRYASLRYFNAAGCDSEGELGELHDPETHLIPLLLLHVLDPRLHPVKINGDDYPTSDGTCVRDYVHVEDLAAAHLSAMELLQSGGESDTFNLGTTHGHSVREVVKAVERATGTKMDIPVGPRRAGDPPRLVAGSKKARNLLRWVPKHDLDSIVRTAWKWTKEKRK